MLPGISAISSGLATAAPGGIAGAATSSLATSTASVDPGQSFASMLANAAGNTVNSLKQAEQLSIDALQGKADMRAVVDTVMSAEQSLQAAVAIRDKIVSAYLEVSRMAI